MRNLRTLLDAATLQLRLVRDDPNVLLPLAANPFFTIVFLLVVRHAGRGDLTAYAILAPGLMGLWATAVRAAVEVIESDRWSGTLDPTVSAPARFDVIVLGRIATVVAVGALAFPLSWLVGLLCFGVALPVPHPGQAVLGLLVAGVGTAVTTLVLAALLVLARNVRTVQNALTYPVYLLGGVLVPTSLLPVWSQPVSRLIYLSWAADLLRAGLRPDPVTARATLVALAVAAALLVVTYLIGRWLLNVVLHRLRTTGTLGNV